MRAFVTDGDQRAALAITRSLGRHGVDVIVGEDRPVSLASSSRYCTEHVTYPSAYKEPEAFEDFLHRIVERKRPDIVIPVTDVTTHPVALHKEALSRHTIVAAPPFDAFELVTNKRRLLERAVECGIPIPRTLFVDGARGLRAVVNDVRYPAVVKAERSRLRTGSGWVGTAAHYVYSEQELWRLYRQTDYLARWPSLIQERIHGDGLGVFVLCDRGQLVTAFGHRRLRERPPSGGASVLCESVAIDPTLLAQAARLLGPLGWHGVAMLEYKQDVRTGRAALIEVNGRFWGSLQLAVDAGVDFPYLSYQLALGRPVQAPAAYSVGIATRWLVGDLEHLLIRLFRSNRDLPDSAPSKPRVVLDFLRSAAPDVRSEMFRRGDCRPAWLELRQYARELSASLWARRPGSPVVRPSTAP
jgi:predicted ATP-grasp superfamily ATP-dependent carboligase